MVEQRASAIQPAVPWGPDDMIVVKFAIGSLSESLLGWLKTKSGIHAETLMTAIGALAGFAAQNAVWEADVRLRKPLPEEALVKVETKSGETFYFGDLINRYLVNEGGSKAPLWEVIASAAFKLGLPVADLPDPAEMFAHASKVVESAQFGVPRVPPNHQPQLTPRELLNAFWPRVRFIFERKDGPGPAQGRNVDPAYWPAAIAFVALGYVTQVKQVLDPKTSLILIMESAIAMSKVDPKTVPQQVPPNG